jgi:tetraacyldisaccharide 4'-kinase
MFAYITGFLWQKGRFEGNIFQVIRSQNSGIRIEGELQLNQQAYRKLISGQSKGAGAAIARFFLRVVSSGYAAIIGVRNLLYSKEWLKVHRANVPVISVGNITVGGTGKTPTVIWLYHLLTKNNIPCAILTRGYKVTQNLKLKTQNYGDEPAILAENCPAAKVIVNPDRVAGAEEAINKCGAQVLIMDDGFQHRRLGRDLDIVAIDATCPFGYGRLLPAGLLREPVSALKRADAAIITRADQINKDDLDMLEAKLQHINPKMAIARSIHKAICTKAMYQEQISVEKLRGKKIFAFCGIGNPDAFLASIRRLGAEQMGSKIYNDHYAYTDADIYDIYEEARYLSAELILTTQKDWTKISTKKLPAADIPFAYLAVELAFTAGEKELKQLIEKVLGCSI